MSKQIPFQFSCIPFSPMKQISDSLHNVGRLNVAVFAKYKNRNGSYITDNFSEELIKSAITCPVVGFYDRSTNDWAGHLGPTLVSAYGYVDYFVGWEPFTDSDGITRDYAVFSVVMFSDYFEEAQRVFGKNQSMELNVDTIQGEWSMLGDEEYFIYTEGKMKGLCILGDSTEPCFSSSHFFEKRNNESQFDKLSSLLFELKIQVEEAEKGGETSMENFEEQVQTSVEEEVIEAPATEEVSETVIATYEETPAQEEKEEEVIEPSSEIEEPAAEEPAIVETTEEPILHTATVVEMEKYEEEFNLLTQENQNLKNQISELTATIESLNSYHAELEGKIESYQLNIDSLSTSLEEANATIKNYQLMEQKMEDEKKQALIQEYEKFIPEEEFKQVSAEVSNFSYDELESKLAITFARKNLNNRQNEASKVYVAEEAKSPFEALISKYKKN